MWSSFGESFICCRSMCTSMMKTCDMFPTKNRCRTWILILKWRHDFHLFCNFWGPRYLHVDKLVRPSDVRRPSFPPQPEWKMSETKPLPVAIMNQRNQHVLLVISPFSMGIWETFHPPSIFATQKISAADRGICTAGSCWIWWSSPLTSASFWWRNWVVAGAPPASWGGKDMRRR